MIYRRHGRAVRQVEPTLPDWPEEADFDRRAEANQAKRTRLSHFKSYLAPARGDVAPIRPGLPAEYMRGEPLLIEEELDRL